MNPFFPFMLALPSMIIVSALTLSNPSLLLPGSVITNVTSLDYVYACDGAVYGSNLNSSSCTDALNQIDSSSTTQQTYGPRFRGPFDVKLPKKYISADGSCVIETKVVPREFSARASLQQVASAARYVMDRCVTARPSRGGDVRDIGGDNNLSVDVKKDNTHVQCTGTMDPSLLASCQNIVDTMSASRDFTTWGPPTDPLAVMKLPITYYSLDQRCKLRIITDGATDTWSRFQSWHTAVALTGVCVRNGRVGRHDGMGMRDHLSMEIGPA